MGGRGVRGEGVEEGEEARRKGTRAAREGAGRRGGRSQGKGGARGVGGRCGVGGKRRGPVKGKGASVCAAVFESQVSGGMCLRRAPAAGSSPRLSVGGVGLGTCGPAPALHPDPTRLHPDPYPPRPPPILDPPREPGPLGAVRRARRRPVWAPVPAKNVTFEVEIGMGALNQVTWEKAGLARRRRG